MSLSWFTMVWVFWLISGCCYCCYCRGVRLTINDWSTSQHLICTDGGGGGVKWCWRTRWAIADWWSRSPATPRPVDVAWWCAPRPRWASIDLTMLILAVSRLLTTVTRSSRLASYLSHIFSVINDDDICTSVCPSSVASQCMRSANWRELPLQA